MSLIQDFDKDRLYLVIGKSKMNITRVEQHPNYKTGSFLANIALVELDRPVYGVKPVFLPCGRQHRYYLFKTELRQQRYYLFKTKPRQHLGKQNQDNIGKQNQDNKGKQN